MSRKMKDSGIEWIGDIPEEWDVSTLGKVSSIQTGNTPSMQGNENYYIDGSLLWVKPDNLKSFISIKETKDKINELGYDRARIVKPNTPLICCIGSIGKFGYSEEEVAYNQQINAVEFDESIIQWKYGLYYLSTQEEQHWYYSTGNVVQILNTQNQKRVSVPIPNVYEQQKIANFLDEKVAEIDHILDKTRESIEEYKKYKQSIINEAVIKGLHKDVPMKDSGIEWIGEIPTNYVTTKLRRFSYIRYGLGEPPKLSEDGLPIIRATNIERGKILNSNLIKAKLENISASKDVLLKEGDILIVRSGAYAGDSAYVTREWEGAIAGYDMIISLKLLNPKYVAYSLLSDYILKEQLYLCRIRSAQPHINAAEVGDIVLVVPPQKEQQQIVDFLDSKCSQIDILKSQKEQLLSDLQSYKKSLIYECVTGKREVI